MSKKLVGIIVAVLVILIILVAFAIGGLRLQKSDDTSRSPLATSSDQVEQTRPQSQAQQRQEPPQQTQQAVQETPQSQPKEQQVIKQEPTETVTTVADVVNNSSRVVDTNLDLPEGFTAYEVSEANLEVDTYEMTGVVREIAMVDNVDGIQSHYKAYIEVNVGSIKTELEYFTTANSLEVLKEGVSVNVRYSLTTNERVVIKGVSLTE